MHSEDKVRQLAVEVAQALDDMHSVAMHEGFARQFSEQTIQKNLKIALSYADHEIDKSRAAIYVGLMKRESYGSRYPRP